ncbi:MAG: DUF975 family protein [Candidatus Spyradocola sp.]
MWNRAQLKQNARDVLRNNYWMALLVSLVAGLLVNVGGGAGGAAGGTGGWIEQGVASGQIDWITAAVFSTAIGVVAILTVLVGLAVSFFLAGPVQIGLCRYYLESREGRSTFGSLFYTFSHGYLNSAAAMFVTDLFVGLWSLLFIIPGIVKGLAWSQVPYLLAENPGMTGKRARELSDRMTYGHKCNIFVLQLSFLGWILLGCLACGVGTLFVAPYIEATSAELYATLRGNALASGWTTPEELPGAIPAV